LALLFRRKTVKLALNVFAARLILEAARVAIMWVLSEALGLRSGRTSGSPSRRR
jgi:hypothetical protein